jgi:hypothetical protein
MTSRRTRSARARAAPLRAALPGLILALVVGLVWMHALTAGQHRGAPSVVGYAESVAAVDACAGHGRPSECPPHQPEHPGPVCQAAAVPGVAVVAVPAPAVAAGRVSDLRPVPVSAATAAGDAGAGTGCGPPSLTMLSISAGRPALAPDIQARTSHTYSGDNNT